MFQRTACVIESEAATVCLRPDGRCDAPHLDTVLDFALVEDAALLERRRVWLGVHIEREEALLVIDAPCWLHQYMLCVALLHLSVALDVWVHHQRSGQQPVCPDVLRINRIYDEEHHGHLQVTIGPLPC